MLIAINSNKETRYVYDAFHRRVAKIEGNKTTRYLYVGQDEIGSIDDTGQIQELRILGQGHGAEIGATIAIELQDKIFSPSHDFRGNIVSLSDIKGNSIETYRYTAFGETTIYNAKGEEISASLISNPWRFSSKRHDEESGFIYFGRRYYDPGYGRWITADPLGLSDGTNLYCYLHHNPVNAFDFHGLQEETREGQKEPYYPLQNVDAHDNTNYSQNPEDASPNEAPLGFIEKKMGKKGKMYYCGLTQMMEMGMGFLHGIMNSLKDAYTSAKALSQMAHDQYVTFQYHESHGLLFDLIRCSCELYFYMETPAVKNQKKMWDAFFAFASPAAMYYHFCHSEGAIITRNALMSYPEELRQRIIVVAIAPGAYIEDKYAFQVTHYRSTRDIVPFFDFVGAYKCRDSTVVLKPHPDAPLFDHSVNSPTYRDVQRQHVNQCCQKYGGSACAQTVF
jgi:RHS repeat-associated protein